MVTYPGPDGVLTPRRDDAYVGVGMILPDRAVRCLAIFQRCHLIERPRQCRDPVKWSSKDDLSEEYVVPQE